MTEEEAKAKWCPFVRSVPVGGNGPANRWDDTDDPPAFGGGNVCIASSCMAWRWSMHTERQGEDQWLASQSTTDGFCGLSGSAGFA